MLLLDTGVRRAELADLQLAHVDLDLDVLLVLGKGHRERALPFGHKAGEALERYLRVRTRQKHAQLPWVWIGLKGRLTAYGVVMILRRRGRQAGLPDLHPHQFHHTFAHQWLAEGGGETDRMRLAGCKSRAMLQRYGASAADARAPRGPSAAAATSSSRSLSMITPRPDGGLAESVPSRHAEPSPAPDARRPAPPSAGL
jgi:site-specific recombinase XerD